MIERQFLVQRWDRYADEHYTSIMNYDELIKYIDMSDCHGEDFEVYEVSQFGRVEHLNYQGWQPHCLIELVNDRGQVIVSGYGTDH